MWPSVAIVETEFSDERIASIIKMAKFDEIGTTLAASNLKSYNAELSNRILQIRN
jgi:hypothetical protein